MGGSPRNLNLSEKPQLFQPYCDYCSNSTALLYCRADSAKLCFSCDREVHSTNQLFSKHTRTLLCNLCNDSSATILCSTESSVFCQNCDWENHNLSLSPPHERRGLEGFTGCPSVSELLSLLGLHDIEKKSFLLPQESEGDNGFLGCEIEGISDLSFWDSPSFVSLDDLIPSSPSSHNFRAMEVPPLPKNRKAACGRHKEEILNQLREMMKFEPLDHKEYMQPMNLYTCFEHDTKPDIVPSNERLRESIEPMYQVVPNTSFEAHTEETPAKFFVSTGGDPHTHCNNEGTPSESFKSETLSTAPKAVPPPYEMASQERDSALLRYKQKKKTRRYDKHIRYESRKVRAESRTRVKGRFAKIEH